MVLKALSRAAPLAKLGRLLQGVDTGVRVSMEEAIARDGIQDLLQTTDPVA